jgi:tRNA-splicing ligase RtcB
MFQIPGTYSHADVMIDTVEPDCIEQIRSFLNHPLYEGSRIAIMPDTHGGKGSVIGFTCTLNGQGISPNVVGVDIGCGMNCWEIGSPGDLAALDAVIRSAVPLGMSFHERAVATMENDFPWSDVDRDVARFVLEFNRKFGSAYDSPVIDYAWFTGLADKIRFAEQPLKKYLARVDQSLGTLGGGNHFIEIDADETGQHWLVIHSGSRNLGKRVADYFQVLAQGQEQNRDFPKDLAYLRGQDMMDYLTTMVVMRHFAGLNRSLMGRLITSAGNLETGAMIETIHNYIDDRDFTIRKGAIRSYAGERMLIPFNMRDGSWLCEGKSNPDWNCSAPHGAGRVMSRNEARRTLNLDDYIRQMEGIFTTSVDINTLDEAPDSYKPASVIQDALGPTATIIRQLKPVYNLKSSEDSRYDKGKVDKRVDPDNSPDAIWARVKRTLPAQVLADNEESFLRAEFEKGPRAFCDTYRKKTGESRQP